MIESVNTLEEVLEPYAGQTVWCESEQKVYRWDPVAGWEEMDSTGSITISAYEMNKQIIGQMHELTKEELQEKKQLIYNFIEDYQNLYYMLLCRDINYYTLFARQNTNPELLEDILVDECLPSIGIIKSIESTENGEAIEIWMHDSEDNVYVAYLFPYDAGVVVCS